MDTSVPMLLHGPSTSRMDESMFPEDLKIYKYFDAEGKKITGYERAGDTYYDYSVGNRGARGAAPAGAPGARGGAPGAGAPPIGGGAGGERGEGPGGMGFRPAGRSPAARRSSAIPPISAICTTARSGTATSSGTAAG